jgi:hypothetical protein
MVFPDRLLVAAPEKTPKLSSGECLENYANIGIDMRAPGLFN